ncbi:enhanced intracellular survival protein Eis [Paenibacillus sp. 32O-W]|uniref:GNAT family N-acetyltransferase n=1 Tax=Paenibacillus sp. 32O-W TaxID=1695218 RepID=UPI0011A72AF4|nr:GNAT family N-acetyltransferase [Paenibacillus sp. 32O-W]
MRENIRPLTQAELPDSIKLSEFAFQYELSPEQRAERIASAKPGEQWGYFIEDKLAAKMTIYPMATWINGKRTKFAGVASVATWPEYRRQGMVGKLLVNAFHIMKEQGLSLSCLHPFEFSFYRKFGWETYVEYQNYELESRHLPHQFAIEGRIERTEDRNLIKAIYESYAASYNGMLERTDEWWENRIWKNAKGTAAVYYNEADQPAGYMMYKVADSIMTIHEMVFLDEKARASLWKFIANHDSMIRKVCLRAPSDDELPFLLHDPRFKQEKVPYFMARIVDAEAFVKEYRFNPAGERTRITLALEDRYASWNQGIFSIEIDEEGSAQVKRSGPSADEADAGREEAQLTCDIQTLTAMLVGYRKPAMLHRAGRLQGTAEAVKLLEDRLPDRTTYLMDYY